MYACEFYHHPEKRNNFLWLFSVNCWFHFSFLFGTSSEKNAIEMPLELTTTQQMLDVAYCGPGCCQMNFSLDSLLGFYHLPSWSFLRGGFISSEAEQGKFACEVISAFDSNHHCPLTLCAYAQPMDWNEQYLKYHCLREDEGQRLCTVRNQNDKAFVQAWKEKQHNREERLKLWNNCSTSILRKWLRACSVCNCNWRRKFYFQSTKSTTLECLVSEGN